jgi:hypothetical protein
MPFASMISRSKGRTFPRWIAIVACLPYYCQAFCVVPRTRSSSFVIPARSFLRKQSALSSSASLDTILLDSGIRQDNLPSFVSENPTLAVGVAVALVALSTILTRPPKRLLNDNLLQEILQGTYLAQRIQQQSQQQQAALKCVYKASRDGWSATTFHEKVDNCGSGIVVAKTARSGALLGGFNPNGWRSTDDYTSSTTAFLWCLARGEIHKYAVQPQGPAVFDYATSGPAFGTADLVLGPPQGAVMGFFTGPQPENDTAQAGSLQQANILPGATYATDDKWPVRGYKVRLQEVEVYCLVDTGGAEAKY